MKKLRVLGLTALIAGAVMALAAPVGATTVTTTTGGAAATPTIHLVNEGGHLILKSGSVIISCASTIEATVASHGASAPTISTVSHFTLTGCTNFWHITTVNPGALSIHWTSGHTGTVTWTGAKLAMTRLGVTCVFETKNTHIGTVTGGNPATLHINAFIPIVASESAEICGNTHTWEGSYSTTSALYVAP